MQKSLILILVIALAGSQCVYASTGDASRPVVKQTDDSSGESAVRINSDEGRDLGQNILPSVREDAEAATPLSISSSHDMAEVSDSQVTTGTPQAPPQQPRHKHHLRNALIAFGACFAMALLIAVASK